MEPDERIARLYELSVELLRASEHARRLARGVRGAENEDVALANRLEEVDNLREELKLD